MEERFEFHKQLLWDAFTYAEQEEEIEVTAQKFFEALHEDVVQLAALITVLNHKCWYWYGIGDTTLSELYSDLYYKYNEKAWDWLEKNGTEEERNWFFHTLD